MRSFSLIVALLFAFVATSYAFPDFSGFLEVRKDGKNGTSKAGGKNGTAKNPEAKACSKMAKLTKLTNLANNQTKIDALVAKGKLNQTEVDALKTKAANATTELQAMQGNTTLVQECAVIGASKKLKSQCKKMKGLEKLSNLATNKTAMDAFMAKEKLNETQMAKLNDRIANATTKLKTMQGNQTLVDQCKTLQSNSQKGSDSSSGTQAQSSGGKTSGASQIAIQGMSYALLPVLGAVFAIFL